MDIVAGGPTQQPTEHRSDSDTSSYASRSSDSGVSEQVPSNVCQWRTARFHDQECSRYFDCPSHQVERVLSDAGDDGEQHQDFNMEDEEDHPDPGAVSPLSEDGDADAQEGAQRPRSPSPDLPTIASGGGPSRPAGSAQDSIVVGDSSPVESQRRRFEPPSSPVSNRPGRSIFTTYSENVENPPNLTPRGAPTHPAQFRLPMPSSAQSPPIETTTTVAGPSELVLPRWQPDAEATYCFICRTQFSIFVRKHHCRKCGRVVCASCSPHRITIPYQYIVQPPGASNSFMSRGVTSPSPAGHSGFGGGASVRLCNPCVPDPNITPPNAQANTQSNASSPAPYYFGLGLGSYFSPQLSDTSSAHARSRSVTMQAGGPSSSRPPRHQYPQSTESRILSGTPPIYYPSSSSTSRRPTPYHGSTTYPAIPNFSSRGGSTSVAGPSSSSSSSRVHRRLPPLPNSQQQIPEEDECPVCHRELPPRTLPDFEARREAHIAMCITSHSAYNGGAAASSSPGAAGENPLPPVPPRRTGMFPYKATEKDCVDSANVPFVWRSLK